MVDVPADTTTTSTIAVGGIISGVLETPGDHDWYAITLTAGQSITITLNGSGASPVSDTYLNLRDSFGNIISHNDDSGAGLNSKIVFTASSAGTYYIDAGAWDTAALADGSNQPSPAPSNTITGGYTLSVQPYTPPPVWNYDQIADQLVNGFWNAQGGQTSHHFNVTQGGTITVNIAALNAAEQNLALTALAEWSDIIGVTFRQVTTGGQIVFHNQEETAGTPNADTDAHFSGGIISSADVYISTSWVTRYGTTLNSYSFQTYLHEIGHALGLGHAGDYNGTADYAADALYANDSWSTSIMSYFDDTDNSYFANQGFSRDYALTPMDGDVVAMQELYGLSTTTRTGDTTYGFNSTAGRDVYDATKMPKAAYTIFDSGGNDTLDYSNTASTQTINLNPETFSNVLGNIGNVSIARGTVIENAIGGSGNDTIIGNDIANRLMGGAGNDTLFGGGGDDFLDGGSGVDQLTGGAGSDTFSGTIATLNGDSIMDFGIGDKIVFSDATLNGFSFSLAGNTLTYSGGSLAIAVTFKGAMVASAAPGGGVQLILSSTTYGYDTQGRLISADVYNNDGSHTFISVDAANSQPWSQQWFNYDVQGRLFSEDVRNDNGSHTFINLDATSTHSWSQDWLSYDAQGRLTSEDIRFDDGSHTFINIDAAGTQNWSQNWSTYDSAGRLTSQDVRNDDGSHTYISIDANGTQSWSQEWFAYDAQGRLTSEDVRKDDGSHTFISVDANGSQSWSQQWFNYDALGNHMGAATVWDDGHVTYSTF